MKVLLSIKPEYAEKIFQGEKRFEFRKSVFKNKEVKSIVVYATMPVGKIIGEFEIDGIIEGSPSRVWEETKGFAGISLNFFSDYFSGRDKAFAIRVGDVMKYDPPIDLNDLGHGLTAPQSFRYIM